MLSHLDGNGQAVMVNVSEKVKTKRVAIASGSLLMKPETLELLNGGRLKKGDALTVAKIAGIFAAKKTDELIPLCHSIPLEHVTITYQTRDDRRGLTVIAEAATSARTGVEMEALSAVSITLLTIYDMAKAIDPAMVITEIKLLKKTGGKSDYSI